MTRLLVNTWRRQGRVLGPVLRDMHGVEMAYTHVLQRAGALPCLTPQPGPGTSAAELLDGFDGLMVIGGEDLAAEVSGAAPEAIGDNADAARDRWDVTLLSAALETGVRVLAICCRGMQLLNVAFGGSLYGHMTGSSPELPPVPHDLTAALDFRHGVVLAPRSRIRAATGVKVIETNSLNHQFVDRLGDGLVVIGVAADGVVEAVEPATATWWVGVQWHPELRADDAAQRALVEEFVDTCRAGREQHPGGLSPRRLPTTTGRAS